MVRAKKEIHGSEWTWCVRVSQHGFDDNVREKKGTH